MKRDNWTVTTHAVRPAGQPDRCFYCGEKIGSQHKEDCVIRTKTVLMEFRVSMVVSVPEHWDENDIEFEYNYGTWCADNLMDMLDRKDNGCLCNFVDAKYIRDATDEDEIWWGITRVKDEES